MTRGRPLSGPQPRVPMTTTQPAALVAWLRTYAEREKVPMAQIVTRALLELRRRVEGVRDE